MTVHKADKLTHLSQGAIFDLTCAEDPAHRPDPSQIKALGNLSGFHDTNPDRIPGVSQVTTCGRSMPVLKVLQTSHCEFNCHYCAFRKDADYPRESLTPTELAAVTNEMSQAGIVEGLFLSSGIGSNLRRTMTRIVDTARILRDKYLYTGYIHLKILPGSSIDLIEAAGQYADRLSINMEAPSETALKEIAPNKTIKTNILKQMQWIETLRRQGKIPRRVGQTTQFVVGGTDDPGSNDRALITASEYLYRELEFRRIYYSPFNPIPGTPLQDRSPENPKRSLRLYQADRLLALYGFKLDDFIFNDSGRLDLETDPKIMWAEAHPELFPIEITRAEPTQLLRIPGIGPLTVKRILIARSEGRLKSVDDFKKLGRVASKALQYILVNGRADLTELKQVRGWKSTQLELPFGAERELAIATINAPSSG